MSLIFQTIILAAGETRAINTKGRVFVCDNASGDFAIRLDQSAEITMSAKRVYGSSTSPEFKLVTVRNTQAGTNTILYAITDADVQIEKQVASVIATITVAAMKNAPTYTKGTTGTVGGGGTAFSGLNGTDVRKTFSVFNNEAAGSGKNISVQGANGTVGHIVTPQTGYVVEAGGAITLTGSGFAYAAMETFYS